MTLACEQVENWLEHNPQWTSEYFQRKTTVEFVLEWIRSNGNLCKERGISYTSGDTAEDVLNNNANVEQNNEMQKEEVANNEVSGLDDAIFQYHSRLQRRFSEPGITNDSKQTFLLLKRHHSLVEQTHSTIHEDEPKEADCIRNASSLTTNSRSKSKELVAPSPVQLRHRSIAQLGSLIESRIKLPSTKTLDQGKKLNLKRSNEEDFFYEIIKDIANNLNLKTLSYNILVNIGILTNADRCSLFLVEGPIGRRSLVSKLFDVHPICLRSTSSESSGIEIRVPWGKGIVGYAADTGQTVNIEDAYADARFNQDVDKQTGYRTKSLLCKPIKNSDGQVVGVAQLINKNPDASPFTIADQEVCDRYLPFCGIGITNAQLFELSQKEFQRNKVLIEMIHDIFEEQTSISKVVNRVMRRSLKLMKCEHCSVLLLSEPLVDGKSYKIVDKASENLKFSNNFHLKSTAAGRYSVIPSDISPELLDALTVLSEHVVSNAETLCISDVNEDSPFKSLVGHSFDKINSLLSMPMRNSKSEILGVASLINKTNKCPFDENDISLFEAIVLFCGLGINNTMLYDQMAKAKANQQVALEVLSYHAKSPQVEVEKLKLSMIPTQSSLNLGSMKFDDFSLDSDEMLRASVRMFLDCGLIEEFNIDYQTLCWWLTTTRKNYRNVIYHNWRHAFNVAQSMFALLTTGNMQQYLSKLECLALLAGCLCHDVDHRGTNNAFQEKIASPLAMLYGTSVMEHHHFNHTIMILNTEGHNVFKNLSSMDYRKVVSLLRHSILATDLALNFKYRSSFFPLVENGELNTEKEEHRSMLRAMMMTSCDLCGITKPWKIQREVVNLVTSEFIQQGDIERERFNENEIPAIMDREKKSELPKLQVQFFDSVGIPVFRICAKVNPALTPLLDGAIKNRNFWDQLQHTTSNQEET